MQSKTATAKNPSEVVLSKENNALTVVSKKKMSVQEKIDSLLKLEALVSKVDYLRECKNNLEKFGTGNDGFQGAKLKLICSYNDDVVVSNPVIVEELVKLSNMRVREALIKAEKEVEDFEII